jgi:hypothetical protein
MSTEAARDLFQFVAPLIMLGSVLAFVALWVREKKR